MRLTKNLPLAENTKVIIKCGKKEKSSHASTIPMDLRGEGTRAALCTDYTNPFSSSIASHLELEK
jgi:hypothetical protein